MNFQADENKFLEFSTRPDLTRRKLQKSWPDPYKTWRCVGCDHRVTQCCTTTTPWSGLQKVLRLKRSGTSGLVASATELVWRARPGGVDFSSNQLCRRTERTPSVQLRSSLAGVPIFRRLHCDRSRAPTSMSDETAMRWGSSSIAECHDMRSRYSLSYLPDAAGLGTVLIFANNRYSITHAVSVAVELGLKTSFKGIKHHVQPRKSKL